MIATASKPAADVVVTQFVWKTPAMAAMCVAVCELAIARGAGGQFSALDLPAHGAERHGGAGIAGSVFGTLVAHEVIAPVGGFLEDGSFIQKRVRNAGGNPIGVWRLASAARARSVLAAHGVAPRALEQAELGL